MHIFALLPLCAGIAYALPPENCETTTVQVIEPTTTATYTSTAVVTVRPSTAQDLGTFTLVSTIKSTKTHFTLTTSSTECQSTATATVPKATTTAYAEGYGKPRRREMGLHPRADCTVTETSTTTYGQTQTWVMASGKTSTRTAYTEFFQATVTEYKSSGIAHFIATATDTTTAPCGGATVTDDSWTSIVTLDARCSPSAMISAYSGFGIDWLSDTPMSGGTYETTTDNASECCQQCAVAEDCSASAWDIRTGKCKLEFATDYQTGELNCGQPLLGYYDAGPSSPMSPGAGWHIANVCGKATFGQAKPDDGT
ncbi:hypothetical protein TI39_contig357g00025 [Zymoseptoria brevis]|uniref:Apple domain-containing protein n=1 Tax=Zymoseptoria brevis TaxID=1047168 RepID=A0A0F4GPX1_9PEZI|nr:hypothetical protein TI39_contig357g00025 [Zymoseptoria brevis]